MTSRKEREKKFGLTGLNIKETTRMGRSTGTAFTYGQMEVNSQAIGKRIRSQGSESIIGVMAEFLKDIGRKIKCTAKGYTGGQMEECIAETMSMIKKKGTENIPIQTDDAIKVCGKIRSNMEKESSLIPLAIRGKENGLKARECTG